LERGETAEAPDAFGRRASELAKRAIPFPTNCFLRERRVAAGVSHCGELGNEMAIRGINVAREGSDERNKATGTLLTSRSISFSGGSQAMQFDLLRHIN
jgi:hypothetical protein